jgi:hypothetical protein
MIAGLTRMSLQLVVFILLQLTPRDESNIYRTFAYSTLETRSFVLSYLMEWSSEQHCTFSCWRDHRFKSIMNNDISQTHHIRYYDVSPDEPTDPKLSVAIPLSREKGKFLNSRGGQSTWLREMRSSVAVITEHGSPYHIFTIIQLVDTRHSYFDIKDLSSPINGADEIVGLTTFLEILMRSIDEACESWARVLDALDLEVGVSVCSFEFETMSLYHGYALLMFK